MVGRVGIEPTTKRLKAFCSTTELPTRKRGLMEGTSMDQAVRIGWMASGTGLGTGLPTHGTARLKERAKVDRL